MLASKSRLAVIPVVLALAAGCDDPADDVPQAKTGEPVSSSEPSEGQELPISPESSKIDFVGSKVTGKHDGGFREFDGTIRVSPDGKVLGAKVVIDMSSTYTDAEKLTGHLKSEDFFHVEKFPEATFETVKIAEGAKSEKMPDATHTVTGNLTLHGITKSIEFPAKIGASGGKVSVESDFAINRKDFDINYPGKPDDLIRDNVRINLSIEAARKAS